MISTQSLMQDALSFLKKVSENGRIITKDFGSLEDSLPYSVAITIQYEGNFLTGYGTASTKDQASFCAVMELLERVGLISSKAKNFRSGPFPLTKCFGVDHLKDFYPEAKNWINGTSNGIAIHTNKSKAKENALSELIERHTILKALALESLPTKFLEKAKILDGHSIPHEIEYNFFYWKGPLDYYISLLRIQKGGKKAYSFGSSLDLSESLKKAFRESIPKIHFLLDPRASKKISFTLNKQLKYHWSTATPWTDSLLLKASNRVLPIDADFKKCDIWFGSIDHDYGKALSGRLHLIQAVSPKTQPLFKGPWRKDVLNPFAIQCDQLPTELHMIG